MPDHSKELVQLLCESVLSGDLKKAVFSRPRKASESIHRVEIRPVELRDGQRFQFASLTETQVTHQNLDTTAAATEVARLCQHVYRSIRLVTDTAVTEARTSKKGLWFLKTTAVTTSTLNSVPVALTSTNENSPAPVLAPHDRARNYLIPEGVPCPFLIHTGVMSREGKVHASQSRKFRQINRFLEFINDIVDALPSDRLLRIVDFGCGKSYLTFATHYLFTTILKRDCQIIGLDRRTDVIDTCRKVVASLSLQNLEFHVGDIAGFLSNAPVDLMISLHACDTATDDAIAQAIQWNSSAILAVPCCQHELNEILTDTALAPITSFGITKDRFAALATDTMRASLLTACGYQTQVLEFIEMEHTPKNLLIRAIRRKPGIGGAKSVAGKALTELRRQRSRLGIPPLMLERRLNELDLLASLQDMPGIDTSIEENGLQQRQDKDAAS
ncbi:MAG: SAM-dependent methyltransferase [Planctomycetota bacterium]|nr:SAM-dependent methyltransferase [Planctomycetota bacterium]